MADAPTTDAPEDASLDHTAWDVPKVRDCLRCKTAFESAWSGERICPRCKRSNEWRSGAPLPTQSLSGRR